MRFLSLFSKKPAPKKGDCSYCYYIKYEAMDGNRSHVIRKSMKGHGTCEPCFYSLR